MTKFYRTSATAIAFISLALLTAAQADAQRRGGGAGGGTRATSVRSSASANVNRAGTNNVGSRTNANRPNSGGNTNIGNGNRTNINTGDVNISRDVDIDVDNGWGCCHGDYNGWGGFYAGAVVGATVASATAWRLGAYYSTLPANCVLVYRGTVSYYQCGTYWYQPMYSGMTVTYVAVKAP